MLLLGPQGTNSSTLGKEIAFRPAIGSQTIPEDYGAASTRVEDLDWKLLLMNLQPLVTPIDESCSEIESYQQLLGQYWSTHSPQGNPIGVAPEAPILVTRKVGRLGKLTRNLVVQDEVDTDAEGSDETDGK
ncbi:hypothetical protein O181_083420 [Austropuccinia psidii MF-1]|uniref:Uncharacterized protein n=1 Tax=Austropuccinia psidii MF-1 TaxID=1389203 RepID=A0A9Q3FN43_9BASI|nr:hypothetical protein [Austropuccinia psidii MF-1]